MYVRLSIDNEYGQLSYVEPLIGINECEHHSIFSLPTSSNVYVGPSIDTNKYGQYVLSVPQAGIYYYILPSIDSSDYRNFLRCNPFIMFRRFVQKSLPYSKSEECSKIAQESWESASEEFKEFFKCYTENALNKRNKVYKIVTKKRKPKKKVVKGLSVDQEVHTQQQLQAQSTYQVRSMKPISFKFSPYCL
ncbi:hypothetical protein RclHR1_06290003 [Rhizophagus clarus]|uniref:Uncharacterized protein n=1 Tax=Rhizophagus clarus TaxID=94130 RepID=A0A2Z6RR23_9GLOM|nr:hypothetical protein RclHR1_06290003 [Rhizophagus clarus]GES83266.1 hypothetical protein GLOIN_2v1878847 [Rhizophagus clarus]